MKKMVRQPRTSSPTVEHHQFRRTCGATRDGNVNVNTPQHGMWCVEVTAGGLSGLENVLAKRTSGRGASGAL